MVARRDLDISWVSNHLFFFYQNLCFKLLIPINRPWRIFCCSSTLFDALFDGHVWHLSFSCLFIISNSFGVSRGVGVGVGACFDIVAFCRYLHLYFQLLPDVIVYILTHLRLNNFRQTISRSATHITPKAEFGIQNA